MGYELSFYKTDLNQLNELAASESSNKSGNDQFISFLRSCCEYIDQIEHGSGYGGLFAEYLSTIAGDYFSEPQIYELCMNRKDIYPSASDIEWGYLKLEELQQFIASTKSKGKDSYFEDNDDFEEDLDILEDVFLDAVKNNSDLLCVYS